MSFIHSNSHLNDNIKHGPFTLRWNIALYFQYIAIGNVQKLKLSNSNFVHISVNNWNLVFMFWNCWIFLEDGYLWTLLACLPCYEALTLQKLFCASSQIKCVPTAWLIKLYWLSKYGCRFSRNLYLFFP